MRSKILLVLMMVLMALPMVVSAQEVDYADLADQITGFDYNACVEETGDQALCERLQAAAEAYMAEEVAEVECEAELPALPSDIYVPDGENYVATTPNWGGSGCYSRYALVDNHRFTMSFLNNDGEWYQPGNAGTFVSGLGQMSVNGIYELTISETRIAVLIMEAGTEGTVYYMAVWQNERGSVMYAQGDIGAMGNLVSIVATEDSLTLHGDTGESSSTATLSYMTTTGQLFFTTAVGGE